jgi:hypothetical protein
MQTSGMEHLRSVERTAPSSRAIKHLGSFEWVTIA